MKLTLVREDFCVDGIFATVLADSGVSFVTVEHAYETGNDAPVYRPKLQNGSYQCVRGQHRLHGMTSPFYTFEVTGVVGHTGILFHWGNYNKDSDGCILVGTTRVGNMITDSRKAFASFMEMLEGVDSFELEVK